jgi:PIN domain nuclease of toxin-antitoxin system
LLDTAVIVFMMEAPERLSARAASNLADPSNVLELSTISIAELAIKAASGKLGLGVSEVREQIEDLSIRVLPYSADHVFELFGLPWHHRDPFDRQIIAQAMAEEISVVTPDRAFGFYDGLKVVW